MYGTCGRIDNKADFDFDFDFDNVKVITVTFDQINASLLNKSMNFFQKGNILLTPHFWIVLSVVILQHLLLK